MTFRKIKHILITGASSGLGQALADIYAQDGVTLYLTGRDSTRLTMTADAARAKGAHVIAQTIDVTDKTAMQNFVTQADTAHPLDLVIANAGVSGGSHGGDDADTSFRDIIEINLSGTLNTVMPALSAMQQRKYGSIAVVSSMAGFRGMPNAPAYSIAKCGVRALADALRPLMALDNIYISCIHPGFIKTPLTDKNRFDMPMLMDAPSAAKIIRDGLNARKTVIAFPLPMYALSRLIALLPHRLGDWILMKAPKK